MFTKFSDLLRLSIEARKQPRNKWVGSFFMWLNQQTYGWGYKAEKTWEGWTSSSTTSYPLIWTEHLFIPREKKKRCFFLLYGGNTRVRTDSWDCPKTDAFSNIFPPVLLKTLPRSSHCWQRHTNRHRAGGGERLRHVRLYNPLDCSMPGRVECL